MRPNGRQQASQSAEKSLGTSPDSSSCNHSHYPESLNSKLRDELLNGEIFTTLREAEVLIENWRKYYNAVRPHSSLNYRPPAPEAILPAASSVPYAPLRPAQTLANNGRMLT